MAIFDWGMGRKFGPWRRAENPLNTGLNMTENALTGMQRIKQKTTWATYTGEHTHVGCLSV